MYEPYELTYERILLTDVQNLSPKDKLKKDDLDNQLECLVSYDKQMSDIKTTYDCIVYPTNNGWKAVIDVDNVCIDNIFSN